MRRVLPYLVFCGGIVLLAAGVGADRFDLSPEPDYGRGVKAYLKGDYEDAAREFLPLAEENHTQAQYYLGTMYHKGRGVPQDYVQAYIWATIATANGKGLNRKRAAELRGKLLKILSPTQKAKAKKALQEWDRSHGGKLAPGK